MLVALAVLAGPLVPARSVCAQERNGERWSDATWVDDLNFLAANTLLGGITAGVAQLLRHGSFTDGFARGAFGGGVAYVGKRIAVARFDGAGLLGREVSAVGGSITRNAALGVGVLDTLALPIGPFWVFVPLQAPRASRVRLDLFSAWWLAYAITEDQLTLDWSRTLSAGVPVFRASRSLRSEGEVVGGMEIGGIVCLSPNEREDLDDVFAHERVHILQRDFTETTAGFALEGWLGSRLGAERLPLFERVVPGVGYVPLQYLLGGVWDTSRSLLEVEAYFLETR